MHGKMYTLYNDSFPSVFHKLVLYKLVLYIIKSGQGSQSTVIVKGASETLLSPANIKILRYIYMGNVFFQPCMNQS